MKPLKQELEERGLLYQTSGEDFFETFDTGKWSFFCGFDPTADSLHLGNFIGFMVAVHLMRRGNTYIALTGGATGMIGDPGGKNAERDFLSLEKLDENTQKISAQIRGICENLKNFTKEDFSFDFVDNRDFFKDLSYLDFLREVGKYITVNNMMAKETVKKRIEDPDQSISYTEFSYMLLQGYDYFRLYQDKNVTLQIGGSDQWGNLVTGTELIRKKTDGSSDVLTWPLITDATGKKFGKSEGNALWLNENKTTPYALYQYFMNTSDDDIERYLKMLTLLELEEIAEIVKNHAENPEQRAGQKILAFKVVEILHTTAQAELAEKITAFMFGKWDKIKILQDLTNEELKSFQQAMWGFDYDGQNLFETLVQSGLAPSNSEARNSVKSGAISINEEKISDFQFDISSAFGENNFVFVQKGKKNFRIILR